jgi:hypothetical protein
VRTSRKATAATRITKGTATMASRRRAIARSPCALAPPGVGADFVCPDRGDEDGVHQLARSRPCPVSALGLR